MTLSRRTFLSASGAAAGLTLGSSPAIAAFVGNPVWSDPQFNEPYVDKDEWRDKPVPHRYVHGGFRNSAAKFSFYFPPAGRYGGRFFHRVTGVPGSENASQGPSAEISNIAFAISSGGYYVESNQGSLAETGYPGDIIVDPTVGYRVSAACAQYSRILAAKMYGPHRTYGYVFGSSAGGLRTISGFEKTDVWDGAVPYVIQSPAAVPSQYSVRLRVLRLLGDKLRSVVDAVDQGGSGDIFAGLSEEQAEALREATHLGFPLRSWFNYKAIQASAFSIMNQVVNNYDPTYFQDFWMLPGYLGADADLSVRRARFQHRTVVKKVVFSDEADAAGVPGPTRDQSPWRKLQSQYGDKPFPVAYQIESPPPAVDLHGAQIITGTGKVYADRLVGDLIIFQFSNASGTRIQTTGSIGPGDTVRIDNSNLLALETLHRHQVPTPDFLEFNQFRKPDGNPIYPQRPLLGPRFTLSCAGTIPSGLFNGKMILVGTLMDPDAFPVQSDWYHRKVRHYLGPRTDESFRLWYHDNALHNQPPRGAENRVTSFLGTVQQALLDLSAWVEKGVPPPQSTTYRVENGQVIVPTSPERRKGVQQAMTLNANGGAVARVRVGEQVRFEGSAEMPPGAGQVVEATWDMDGSSQFAQRAVIEPGARVQVKSSRIFERPGTYFVTLRTVSSRSGNAASPFARIENLARVRVVVS